MITVDCNDDDIDEGQQHEENYKAITHSDSTNYIEQYYKKDEKKNVIQIFNFIHICGSTHHIISWMALK